MRWTRAVLFLAAGLGLFAGSALPQPPPTLPSPRLFMLMPAGGKAGTTVEVTFTGADLEEPQALLFSHPGIKAEPIVPPPAAAPTPRSQGRRPPPKPPITKFKVTIAADVPLGIHDVRLVNKWGVSNPRAFVVGDLNEVAGEGAEQRRARGPAGRAEHHRQRQPSPRPTDVDYFVFAGKKGQRVVVELPGVQHRQPAARRPGAVRRGRPAAGRQPPLRRQRRPGRLHPAGRRRLPRPPLRVHLHARAAPEHFYRLTRLDRPVDRRRLPAVVEPGKPAQVTVYGRNLPGGQPDPTAVVDGRVLEKVDVTVTAPDDPPALQRLAYQRPDRRRPPRPRRLRVPRQQRRRRRRTRSCSTYARAPVVLDNEDNDTPETAQEVAAALRDRRPDREAPRPRLVRLHRQEGRRLHIELFSDRLGAPTDMYFVAAQRGDQAGHRRVRRQRRTSLSPIKFFTRTDDPPRYRFVGPGRRQVPAAGRRAGTPTPWPARGTIYRVRITPEQPDFRLVVMPPADNRPDACRVLPGRAASASPCSSGGRTASTARSPLTVEGLPPGVTCPPQIVGAGMQADARWSSAPPPTPPPWTGEIKVKGTATINGQTVVREARPASITWPVQPRQNIPTVSRLDRSLVLAVREQGAVQPDRHASTRPTVVQGDKANVDAQAGPPLAGLQGAACSVHRPLRPAAPT